MITRDHQTLTGQSGAVFSDCERYRYRLWREWDASLPTICFLMLNPSTADEQANDPTIERCQRRAIAWGYGRLEIANLFPWRSTDPDQLIIATDPVGPAQNADFAILDAVKDAQMVVCGWGNHRHATTRAEHVIELLTTAGLSSRLHALKINQDGSPGHPLYLSYDLQPRRYP